jgi:acyl dehydratase
MVKENLADQIGREIIGRSRIAHMPINVGPTVHNDRLAKRAGLKGGFIVNEYHFAQITQMLLEYFGPVWFSHGEIEIKYIAPLLDGDTFIPKARVVSEEPLGTGRLELVIWCENQQGDKLASGRANCLATDIPL